MPKAEAPDLAEHLWPRKDEELESHPPDGFHWAVSRMAACLRRDCKEGIDLPRGLLYTSWLLGLLIHMHNAEKTR